jgi:hypothetical protein
VEYRPSVFNVRTQVWLQLAQATAAVQRAENACADAVDVASAAASAEQVTEVGGAANRDAVLEKAGSNVASTGTTASVKFAVTGPKFISDVDSVNAEALGVANRTAAARAIAPTRSHASSLQTANTVVP